MIISFFMPDAKFCAPQLVAIFPALFSPRVNNGNPGRGDTRGGFSCTPNPTEQAAMYEDEGEMATGDVPLTAKVATEEFGERRDAGRVGSDELETGMDPVLRDCGNRYHWETEGNADDTEGVEPCNCTLTVEFS